MTTQIQKMKMCRSNICCAIGVTGGWKFHSSAAQRERRAMQAGNARPHAAMRAPAAAGARLRSACEPCCPRSNRCRIAIRLQRRRSRGAVSATRRADAAASNPGAARALACVSPAARRRIPTRLAAPQHGIRPRRPTPTALRRSTRSQYAVALAPLDAAAPLAARRSRGRRPPSAAPSPARAARTQRNAHASTPISSTEYGSTGHAPAAANAQRQHEADRRQRAEDLPALAPPAANRSAARPRSTRGRREAAAGRRSTCRELARPRRRDSRRRRRAAKRKMLARSSAQRAGDVDGAARDIGGTASRAGARQRNATSRAPRTSGARLRRRLPTQVGQRRRAEPLRELGDVLVGARHRRDRCGWRPSRRASTPRARIACAESSA